MSIANPVQKYCGNPNCHRTVTRRQYCSEECRLVVLNDRLDNMVNRLIYSLEAARSEAFLEAISA